APVRRRDLVGRAVHDEQRHVELAHAIADAGDRVHDLFGGVRGRGVLIDERIVEALVYDLRIARELPQIELQNGEPRRGLAEDLPWPRRSNAYTATPRRARAIAICA